MAWAKVDDQWFASRKVVPLSLSARGLWTTILSWSCAQQSAHVPGHMVAFLAAGQDVAGETGELERAGLWHRHGHDCSRCDDAVPDGWVLHDWAEYQDKSISEKRAEAGAKGGKKSGETRRGSNGKQPDEANGKQPKQTHEANDEAGTHPGPSRPDPTEEHGDADAPPVAPVDDGFEDFWSRYPRHAINGKPGGGGSRKKSAQRWRAMKVADREAALVAVDHYRAWVESPDGEYPAHATTWLNEARWEQWQEPAAIRPRDGPAPLPDRETTDWTAGWQGRIAQ